MGKGDVARMRHAVVVHKVVEETAANWTRNAMRSFPEHLDRFRCGACERMWNWARQILAGRTGLCDFFYGREWTNREIATEYC